VLEVARSPAFSGKAYGGKPQSLTSGVSFQKCDSKVIGQHQRRLRLRLSSAEVAALPFKQAAISKPDRGNDKSENIAPIGSALLAMIFDPISYPLICCHPVQIRMRQVQQTGPVAYPSCCCLAFVGQETN